jgi:hypothetical protein
MLGLNVFLPTGLAERFLGVRRITDCCLFEFVPVRIVRGRFRFGGLGFFHNSFLTVYLLRQVWTFLLLVHMTL